MLKPEELQRVREVQQFKSEWDSAEEECEQLEHRLVGIPGTKPTAGLFDAQYNHRLAEAQRKRDRYKQLYREAIGIPL